MKTANNSVTRSKYIVQPLTNLRVHPILERFNQPLELEELESLKADMALRGIVNAVQVNEEGEILDGVNRYELAKSLGFSEIPTLVFDFDDSEGEKLHIYKANMMRKKLSTQHKYLTIAKISEIYERGRGGRRVKGKELSDTSLENDVLEETGLKLGVSKELVKNARKYAKNILHHPKYSSVDPTKFLKTILPLQKIKYEPFREMLVEAARKDRIALSPKHINSSKLFDEAMLKADSDEKRLKASNYIIACFENSQAIVFQKLGAMLGLTEEVLPKIEDLNAMVPSEEDIDENASSTSEPIKKKPETQPEILSELVSKLSKSKKQIEAAVLNFEKHLDAILLLSENSSVTVKRLRAHNLIFNDLCNWIEESQIFLLESLKHLSTNGYPGGNDDPLTLFPPAEKSCDRRARRQ